MDDRSLMYKDSPKGLRMMDYCNEVQYFINYATSIPRNICGGGIRYPCKRCQNKKFLYLYVITIHLLYKGFIEEYLCWYAHRESFVPHETMVERIVVLAMCMELKLTTIIFIGLRLWMRWEWIKVMPINV
jgi:hypothetical protein